ncbi:hypothetical protein [Fibrella aestuarina]|nr:hypothetical protein [Fibrella aestuarina]
MEEWPDNHLDELFRKSAEEFDAPFDPADWTDMSRRLDDYDRRTWFDQISRWGGIGAMLLLLLGGLGWLIYVPKAAGIHQQGAIKTSPVPRQAAASTPLSEADRALTREPAKPQATASEATSLPAPVASGNDESPTLALNKSNPATANQPTLTDKPTSTAPVRQPITQPETSPLTLADRPLATHAGEPVGTAGKPSRLTLTNRVARAKRTGRQPGTGMMDALVLAKTWPGAPDRAATKNVPARATLEVPGTDVHSTNVPGKDVPGMDVPGMDVPEAPVPAETPLATDARWLPALSAASSLSSVVDRPLKQAVEVQEVAVERPARRPTPRLSRFSVMVFASPDLSSIGLKNFDRPGSNMGVSVQYQLTDRLSLHTGAMLSTKRYQTYSDEYVWPNPPLHSHFYLVPQEIDGVCKMIDLPLNLRYDWLLRPRGDGRAPARWFATAGMTSYFIQRETYTYEFADPTDPRIGMNTGWDNQKAGRPGGSFGFSNINVSMGYERPITGRLSWQVEPFMKIPLKGVGVFRVKLISTGAFIGLRYRF